MLPAPTAPFDVPTWTSAKVHPDHHVQIAHALYSVPTAYLGQQLDVRLDRVSVRLYRGSELVKIHPRVAPGKRSTDAVDYPVGKAGYALRSVERIGTQARGQGAHVAEFVDQLLAGPLPWTRMRTAYGLLRLCDRYGAPRVDALCARAIAFDVLDVERIERMLKTATTMSRLEEHRQGHENDQAKLEGRKPRLLKPLDTSTRRQYARVVRRVLQLGVYPLKLLTHNPCPRGWLRRRRRPRRAGSCSRTRTASCSRAARSR